MEWKHSSTIYVIIPIVGTCTNFFCNLKHNALIWLDGGNFIVCDFSSLFLITFLLFAVHVSNTFPSFVFDNKYCTYISISNSSLKHSQKQCPVPTIPFKHLVWWNRSFMVAFTSFYFIIFEFEDNSRMRFK